MVCFKSVCTALVKALKEVVSDLVLHSGATPRGTDGPEAPITCEIAR